MKILALDVGKNTTALCNYDTKTTKHRFDSIKTHRSKLDKIVKEQRTDRVVLEIGPTTGWIYDLVKSNDIEVQVANPSHDA